MQESATADDLRLLFYAVAEHVDNLFNSCSQPVRFIVNETEKCSAAHPSCVRLNGSSKLYN
jgi:hypothetical protein